LQDYFNHVLTSQLYSRRLGNHLLITVLISSLPQHVIRAYPTELIGVTKGAMIFISTCLAALKAQPPEAAVDGW
jgi:hypothetical protein